MVSLLLYIVVVVVVIVSGHCMLSNQFISIPEGLLYQVTVFCLIMQLPLPSIVTVNVISGTVVRC